MGGGDEDDVPEAETDEDDAMSFSSVFDAPDEPDAGPEPSSPDPPASESRWDEPDRPASSQSSRPSQKESSSKDKDEPPNDEIEKIWRLLDDLD